ncbi:uncharacterized protein LOC135834099 [Planococcus citri]|uniref:uncharacterized protein LOC135834099 n=1 Tax=Planococcus citri TaxID=170843 RepID=UPI0031FA30D7
MKQQIQVIKSTITNFNETVSNLKLNEVTLNENIKLMNNFISSSRLEKFDEHLILRITDHVNLLSELTNRMETEFDNLTSAILFAKQIDAIFVKEILIFSIKIPLVHSQKFHLYKLLPFPTPSTQTHLYHYIEPSFEYLLISELFTRYAKIPSFENCIELHGSNHLCYDNIIYKAKNSPICETKLLTSTKTEIPSDCTLKSIKIDAEIWEPLKGNEWIFILSNSTKLSVECDDKKLIEDIQLPHIGILSLDPNCRGYTHNTILNSKSDVQATYQNILPFASIHENIYT